MQKKSEMMRTVDLLRLPQKGQTLKIIADADELIQVAKRFSLVDVKSIEASVLMKGQRVVHVTGSFKAEITQKCVVTLEDVPETVEGTFEEIFSPDVEVLKPEEMLEINMDSEQLEPMGDGKVDIGELVLENLALAINPYPRKQGLTDDFFYKDDDFDEGMPENPFAKLAELKKKTTIS